MLFDPIEASMTDDDELPTLEQFLEIVREQADRPDLEFRGSAVRPSERMSERTRRQLGTVWRWYRDEEGKAGLYADFRGDAA